ncbi:MAG: hypothetical protein HY901_06785, partial [Deltaproteobacteria bacterium]|nr:hypothetical protein [Deltaproteobacteria bacterium]
GGWLVVFREGLVAVPWGESPPLLRAAPGGLLLFTGWWWGMRRTFRQTAVLGLLKIGPSAPAGDAARKPEAKAPKA